ncbi:MAG: exodeoxyribonuclease VII large subunit [Lachnospiraceae bacterium]|nr:exodeoxyribonuclease VII large subunit [Lachnospiraceae bacterium]
MGYYRLNVPYKDKETAKSFGAKWYSEDRYWYYSGERLPEGLYRWYPKYVKVEGKDGVYLDTETGEIIGEQVSENNDSVRKDSAIKDIAVEDEAIFNTKSNGFESKTPETAIDENHSIETDKYARYRSVSEINRMINEIVNATNEFRHILVKGEVTNFDGQKGRHYYFAIKDENALLPCVMWDSTAAYALKFKLEKGQQVALAGSLEFYEGQGKAQLIVSAIENIGDGQANLAFLKLKKKLEAEGLFDQERKKPIPKHPAQVGVITSKNGQAIKDICKIAGKRNPYVQLVLFHVNVQGANAVSTIVKGIKTLDKMGLDSIIVGRGGGSDEELNSYNDEMIARAVADAKTPIVSAVGHQGHWTLIDFVADKRVATPSEAAEETIPDVMTDIKRVEDLKASLQNLMVNAIKTRKLLVDAKLSAIEKNSPQNRLNEKKERLKHNSQMLDVNIRNIYKSAQENLINLTKSIDSSMKLVYAGYRERPQIMLEGLNTNMKMIFGRYSKRFEVLLAELNGLSPTAKLVGGFGYVTKDNKAVKNAKDVSKGDEISIRMHDGDISATVN